MNPTTILSILLNSLIPAILFLYANLGYLKLTNSAQLWVAIQTTNIMLTALALVLKLFALSKLASEDAWHKFKRRSTRKLYIQLLLVNVFFILELIGLGLHIKDINLRKSLISNSLSTDILDLNNLYLRPTPPAMLNYNFRGWLIVVFGLNLLFYVQMLGMVAFKFSDRPQKLFKEVYEQQLS